MARTNRCWLCLILYFPVCLALQTIVDTIFRILTGIPFLPMMLRAFMQRFQGPVLSLLFYLTVFTVLRMLLHLAEDRDKEVPAQLFIQDRNAVLLTISVVVLLAIANYILEFPLQFLPMDSVVGMFVSLASNTVLWVIAFAVIFSRDKATHFTLKGGLSQIFQGRRGLLAVLILLLATIYYSLQYTRWLDGDLSSGGSFINYLSLLSVPNYSRQLFYWVNFACVFGVLPNPKSTNEA